MTITLFLTKKKSLNLSLLEYINATYSSSHGNSPVTLEFYFGFSFFSLQPFGNFEKKTKEKLIPAGKIEDQVKNLYKTEISRGN